MTAKGRALVTGGAGLIGSHLVDLLVKTGYGVTVLDSLDPETHPNGKPGWLNPNALFIQGDVRSASDIAQALQGARFVFHQAAFGGFTEQVSKYGEVNAGGTAKIFESIAAQKFPVEKVVVASSQAVYGEGAYQCSRDGVQPARARSIDELRRKDWEPACPKCGTKLKACLTPEEKPREGETPYALSKEFEERLALSLGRQLGIPVVALRYGVTYGPRQSVFNPYTGVVSIFSTRLLNGLAPLVYEDGLETRDFIYVEDVARANLFVMEQTAADGQVFNVGRGEAVTIRELAETLASIYDVPLAPEIPGHFRKGDVRHILLDPSKLNRLGFSAAVSLRDGLGRFAEWIKTQGRVEEYFSAAYRRLKRCRLVEETKR